MTRNYSAWRSAIKFCAGFAVALGSLGVQAQSQDIAELVREWTVESVKSANVHNDSGLRVDVVVGALDARLKLAACGSMEPYLPAGTRLWGKSRVAVRCVDGMSRWNVSVPVTVRVWGRAWVLRSQVAPGATLNVNDVVEAEVNLAEESSPVVQDVTLWLGYSATRQLTTGQTLRADMVRPAQAFQAGSQVKVIAQGSGFRIVSDGQALTAGVVGQAARVRMDNGRVASGTVLGSKTVQVEL